MEIKDNKQKGNAGLSLAIAYFGTNGYSVSLPLNDTQWYDLIIEKDNVFQTVQCKFTASKNNQVSLKSCGGTKGVAYDNILNHPIDLMFCVNQDMKMWVIPADDIREFGISRCISLREEKDINSNKNHFDTSKYLVQF